MNLISIDFQITINRMVRVMHSTIRRPYFLLFAGIALLWVGIKTYGWIQNWGLVTFSAINQELPTVLKEVARQSHQTILCSSNANAQVTVQFVRAPLKEVLDVLRDQANGHWQKCFLVAKDSSHLQSIQDQLVAKGPPPLVTQASSLGSGMISPSEIPKITLEIHHQSTRDAFQLLSLKSLIPSLTDESLHGTLHLTRREASPLILAKQLARKASAKLKVVYYFHVGRRDGGRWFRAYRDQGESQQLMESQLALLPPEEQNTVRQNMDEMKNRMESMTPEERRASFEAMSADPKRQAIMDQRQLERIKNLTPEQRVERNRRFAARSSRGGGR